MRAGILAAASFGALAYAQSTVLTVEWAINGTQITTSTVTYPYDNPATAYLTQTNSDGVVTGLPVQVLPSGAATDAASIPAGLPLGVTSVPYNASGTVTYFTVSIGSSTTMVYGAGATLIGNTIIQTQTGTNVGPAATEAPSSGSGSDSATTLTDSSGNPTATENGASTGTQSASTTSSSGAAGNLKAASAGVFGLGAIFAFVL